MIKMERTPVATAIKHELGRRLGREWPAGQRLPGVQELAKLLGTGQRNTHRALRELVAEGYLVATPGQGTFVKRDFDESRLRAQLHDVPGDVSRLGGRVAGKRVRILVAALDPSSHVATIVSAARAKLEGDGATVDVTVDRHVDATDGAAFDADGVLAFGHNLFGRYRFAARQVACFIRIGMKIDVAMPGRYDVIGSDSEQGAYLAGEHLRKLGHTRAVFIGRKATEGSPLPFEETSMLRLAGFEAGLERAVDPSHYMRATHYDDRTAARLLPDYLAMPDRPRAIFAASDDLALGFIVGAAAHGLDFGRDYHIVGFDGQPRGQNIAGGPLTTVAPSYEQIGARAGELLVSRLLDPEQPVRKLTLGCRLIDGATALPERSNS